MFKKGLILVSLLVCAVFTLAAQTTRVRGTVTDAETGEPLPFVGMYFEGTTIGISTDLQGKYSLETRDMAATRLTASLLGYDGFTVPVKPGSFTEINFVLQPDPKQLNAALVRPDDRYLRSILRRLDRSRAANDPDNAPDWHAGLYTRIELDATDTDALFKIGAVQRNLGQIQEYVDTSAITGKPFLPVMLSETQSDLYHQKEPALEREVLRASRISGVKEDNVLRQFTGSYLLKTNFYKNSISVLNLDIPNPIAESSQPYYNFFLVDSLQVEGRKTYVLRFHPKKLVTSPTVDGEIQFDAQDFGIRNVHVRLSEEANVNWMRHLNIDVDYRRMPDGRWFYDEERLFVDLAIVQNFNSELLSFLVRRQQSYALPAFGPITDPDALEGKSPVVMRDVRKGDDAYWEENRPYALSAREQGIFTMVEDIQKTRFYKGWEETIRALVTSYIPVDAWGVEFGRWPRTFVWNDVEGFRLQLGGRTRRELTEKVRLGGYLAYGFKSRTLGWQATAEFMFRRDVTRKLSLSAQHDFVQLGSGTGVFTAQNMFSSLLARDHANKQSRIRSFGAMYEHEFKSGIDGTLEWTSSRIWSNPLVPFIRTDGSLQDSFSAHIVHGQMRFSWDERINRGPFLKTYLFTKYPVVTLDVMGGIPNISKDDVGFFRADVGITWRTPSFALGFGRLKLDAGLVLGDVPYPLLMLHAGNQTFFLDRTAFSCMNYYEFLSNRWLQGYYEHNFQGFFLNKIPGVRKLDLREVVTCRFAWGSYVGKENAQFQLPEGSSTLETPYVELGAGITNIFRLFRVDFLWRLTHRENAQRNFTVNVGIDLEF